MIFASELVEFVFPEKVTDNLKPELKELCIKGRLFIVLQWLSLNKKKEVFEWEIKFPSEMPDFLKLRSGKVYYIGTIREYEGRMTKEEIFAKLGTRDLSTWFVAVCNNGYLLEYNPNISLSDFVFKLGFDPKDLEQGIVPVRFVDYGLARREHFEIRKFLDAVSHSPSLYKMDIWN